MKRLLLLILIITIWVNGLHAQAKPSIFLDEAMPMAKVGGKVTINYVTADSKLLNKPSINARVFYLDGKNYPVYEIKLNKIKEGLYKKQIKLVADAKAILIRIDADDDYSFEDNEGKFFPLYKQNKPVKGAFSEIAAAYLDRLPQCDLTEVYNQTFENTIEYYQKEFVLHTEDTARQDISRYYFALVRHAEDNDDDDNRRSDSVKALVKQKAYSLLNTNNENDIDLALTLLRHAGEYSEASRFSSKYKRNVVSDVNADLGKKDIREEDLVKKTRLLRQQVSAYQKQLTKITTHNYLTVAEQKISIQYDLDLALNDLNEVLILQSKTDETLRSQRMLFNKITAPKSKQEKYVIGRLKSHLGDWRDVTVISVYVKMLMTLNRYQDAMDAIDKGWYDITFSTTGRDMLKECYEKTYNTDAGYQQHIDSLNKQYHKNL